MTPGRQKAIKDAQHLICTDSENRAYKNLKNTIIYNVHNGVKRTHGNATAAESETKKFELVWLELRIHSSSM